MKGLRLLTAGPTTSLFHFSPPDLPPRAVGEGSLPARSRCRRGVAVGEGCSRVPRDQFHPAPDQHRLNFARDAFIVIPKRVNDNHSTEQNFNPTETNFFTTSPSSSSPVTRRCVMRRLPRSGHESLRGDSPTRGTTRGRPAECPRSSCERRHARVVTR